MNIRTIFDIGANTGQFALKLHSLLPNATIYCFEPLKDCYTDLLVNLRNVPKCQAFRVAIGNEDGETQIYRNDYTPSSSLLQMEELHKRIYPATTCATTEDIEIKRLDTVAGQLPICENLLIKIDVQGAEDQVLAGAEKTLARASVLVVETCFEPLYRGQLLFDGIYELLRPKGFVYVGSEDQRRNPENGRVLFCDSIFCRPSVLVSPEDCQPTARK